MKTMFTSLFALASSGLALTFTPPAVLEVGRTIDLRTLTDTPTATFASDNPEIIEVQGHTAVIKRLSPTGVNVTLSARSGTDRVQRTVTTAGIEVAVGKGITLTKNRTGGEDVPAFIVRARGIDGRPPANLNLAADMPFYAANQLLTLKAFYIGSMHVFIGQLKSGAPSTIHVEAGGYSRSVTVHPDAWSAPTKSLIEGVTAKVQGRNVEVSGKWSSFQTISARVRQGGRTTFEWWKNVNALPVTLPITAAPSGKAEVVLRVYTWPLLDDTVVLPESFGFVQYPVADVTLR